MVALGELKSVINPFEAVITPKSNTDVDEPVTSPVICMFDDVNCVMFALSTEPI